MVCRPLYVSVCDNPRQMICLVGEFGHKGKITFQKYIQSYFGTRKVVQSNAQGKTKSLAHILRKKAITTIDIFLFIETCSNKEVGDGGVNYSFIE